jgi:protein SCO1/2
LFVTLDPDRDTPERLARYVSTFDPSLIALYADTEGTQRMAHEFKIHYHVHREAADRTYEVDHSDQIYLFDTAGRLRLLVNPSALTADAVVQDVRLLLQPEV